MKIGYFSCAKMLYFAEKLLRDDYYTFPDIDTNFAKQFNMTVREIQDIQKQFEHDKLLVWEDVPTEIEDEYGGIKSEISYDALTVNKKKIEEFIKYLKERYRLRENPFIPREVIVSIVKQIKNVLDKNVLIRVISVLSPGVVAWQVIDGKYTLIDLLFRCAYIKTRTEPIIAEGRLLSFVLAEFLNPIYYNIQNKKITYQLFKYMDGIISTYASREDYLDWIKEVKKYVIIKEQAQKEFISPRLKSIDLITKSLEPTSVIFLVLDKRFEMPIRYAVKNTKGEPAYIKKLYDIAYFVDAPNKKNDYTRKVADGINNGLFKKRVVRKYIKTNKFKKPTLVQKSEDGTLVLKDEIPVKTGLIKHDVPLQHQSLYIDKTK